MIELKGSIGLAPTLTAPQLMLVCLSRSFSEFNLFTTSLGFYRWDPTNITSAPEFLDWGNDPLMTQIGQMITHEGYMYIATKTDRVIQRYDMSTGTIINDWINCNHTVPTMHSPHDLPYLIAPLGLSQLRIRCNWH